MAQTLRQQIGITFEPELPSPPIPPVPPWTRALKTGLLPWWRSDTVIKNGSNLVTLIQDKSSNAFNIDCTLNGSSGVLAGTPLWTPNAFNGQPSMHFDYRGGGGFNNSSYAPLTGNIIIGPNYPMGLAWVLKTTSFGPGGYSALFVLTGPTLDTTVTAYFTNSGFGSTLYWQIGAGTVNIIGNLTPYSPDVVHQAVFNYNGAGDQTNPANYSFYVNSTQIELKGFTASGGNSQYNWLGNHGDAPSDVDFGDIYEIVFANKVFSPYEIDQWGTYTNTRYGL